MEVVQAVTRQLDKTIYRVYKKSSWFSAWINEKTTTPIEATVATVVAWARSKARLPRIILKVDFQESMLPKLAWVDSLLAIHISMFPFSPKRVGSKTSNSETLMKTVQFCTLDRMNPAPKFPNPANKIVRNRYECSVRFPAQKLK